ncbi:hypothetical protein [uncultured Gammaproteobacteria bacterium]|nr:hypothetical protein [uncultured Gammaproteobacteria bacterium]CAC9590494.1 hypothetical protein [uncultured Gammaproteobacteria bacterium]CAC9600938.1 hypothetical protein [uncultured Gammaproteobacteria bacterium]
MLDGIDYYPNKPKKNPRLKIWIFALLCLFIGGYFISQLTLKPAEKPPIQTLIVVSKAKKIIEAPSSVIIKSDQTYQSVIDHHVKSDKELDELIQTFKEK